MLFGRTHSIQKVKLDLVAGSSRDAIGGIGEGFADSNLNVVDRTEGGGGSRREQKECADGLHFGSFDVCVRDSCRCKMWTERNEVWWFGGKREAQITQN